MKRAGFCNRAPVITEELLLFDEDEGGLIGLIVGPVTFTANFCPCRQCEEPPDEHPKKLTPPAFSVTWRK